MQRVGNRVAEVGLEYFCPDYVSKNGVSVTECNTATMSCINAVLHVWGWGMSFGHSFCIGSPSFSLAQGVNPEVIQIAGLRPVEVSCI